MLMLTSADLLLVDLPLVEQHEAVGQVSLVDGLEIFQWTCFCLLLLLLRFNYVIGTRNLQRYYKIAGITTERMKKNQQGKLKGIYTADVSCEGQSRLLTARRLTE